MWTLSAFADEIDAELNVQLQTLESQGIRHLDLRGIWRKNVVRLTREELNTAKAALDARGIRVAAIASPIGKIGIGDDFTAHLEDFRQALRTAALFGTRFVRVFSFYIPTGKDPADYRDRVLSRMETMVRLAEAAGVVLIHENEKNIYGDVPERCLDILSTIHSPALRAAWDPANFVQCGVRPFTEGWQALEPYVAYIHVKDARFENGRVVLPGNGDGQWPQTLHALRRSGFDGFFAIEPHLESSNAYGGFSGPERFGKAVAAFYELIRNEGMVPQLA